MYIHHTKANHTLGAIATLVVISFVLWSVGFGTLVTRADAGNLTSISDTLSTSDVNTASNHTFQFTVPNGVMTGQTVVINFPASSFTIPSGFDFNSIDVQLNGSQVTLAAAPGAGTWGVATSTTAITFTTSTSSGSVAVASSTVVIVKIGTNTSFGGVGTSQLVNPVAGSYELTVNGSLVDSGQTRVAILNHVNVTANVDTSLTFTVSGVAIGQTVNSSPTTTSTTSTATSIAFGTLAPNVSKVVAQDLSVTTNAALGFVVTVQQTQNLLSSTGADIDGFKDGTYTNTPTAWTTPLNQITNEDTWGHWGLTSEDDLNGSEFATNKWVAASTTPRQIFQYGGPSDGVTPNKGSTRIGYQAQITSLQEAADDYTTQLIYVATPTF